MQIHSICITEFCLFTRFVICFIFNDTHREELFYSIHYKNGCVAASDLFHMLTQSIKLYTFHYHIIKSTVVLKKFLKQTVKPDHCSVQQVLLQNLSWFLS